MDHIRWAFSSKENLKKEIQRVVDELIEEDWENVFINGRMFCITRSDNPGSLAIHLLPGGHD